MLLKKREPLVVKGVVLNCMAMILYVHNDETTPEGMGERIKEFMIYRNRISAIFFSYAWKGKKF